HNGMDAMIEQHKTRKLNRLARRVGLDCEPASVFSPSVRELLSDAGDALNMAESLYIDINTSNRHAAAQTRMAIGLLMQAAQKMISEQQRREQKA
nr:hypothetical protein [Citrobacter koseri]MDM9271522.1 hypothetical protein [Citrobacter koseri]MDM9276452.1 hypothetical protein [Citrobacter koseri]